MIDIGSLLALAEKHTPAELYEIRRSVRDSVQTRANNKGKRWRRRNTEKARRYGSVKLAVANMPPGGIVVSSRQAAEKYQTVAKRMGIRVIYRVINGGPARLVLPGLSGKELSWLSSQL